MCSKRRDVDSFLQIQSNKNQGTSLDYKEDMLDPHHDGLVITLYVTNNVNRILIDYISNLISPMKFSVSPLNPNNYRDLGDILESEMFNLLRVSSRMMLIELRPYIRNLMTWMATYNVITNPS